MTSFKHISLSITTFTCGKPHIFYYENDHDKITILHDMSYIDACRKMWELKKLGGLKTVEVHPSRPTIVTREVRYIELD